VGAWELAMSGNGDGEKPRFEDDLFDLNTLFHWNSLDAKSRTFNEASERDRPNSCNA
jgi:hypothetical protein